MDMIVWKKYINKTVLSLQQILLVFLVDLMH